MNFSELQNPFYFVRHGQTDHNVKDIIDDPTDISINDTGILQAKKLEPIVATLPIQSICHSPAKRAVETKDLITKNLSVPEYIVEELGECTGKVWLEMLSRKEPSQETLQFIERVKRGLQIALSKPGPVLIISHGGVHFVIATLLGIDQTQVIGNCELLKHNL